MRLLPRSPPPPCPSRSSPRRLRRGFLATRRTRHRQRRLPSRRPTRRSLPSRSASSSRASTWSGTSSRSAPGTLLFTQRDRATLTRCSRTARSAGQGLPEQPGLGVRRDRADGARGRSGLRDNRRIYTCQGGCTGGGGHDVHVIAWTLDDKLRHATEDKELVGGFPTSSRPARRLPAADRPATGSLLVGTGDAAIGTNPENLDSLGGKTLRLDRFTGAPWPTNPYATSSSPRRYVHTYGHRNVQGARRSAPTGRLWSIEQGTDRDDEVNLLVNGGDYGYNPVPGLQRVGPDDRPVPARQADQGPLALRRPDRRPPPAAPSSTARSGAPSTARSRSPASRPAGSSSSPSTPTASSSRSARPTDAAPVRPDPAPSPTRRERRPARHHRQRRRQRRDPAGQPALRRRSVQPPERASSRAGLSHGEHREPDRHRDHRQQQHQLRVRGPPAAGDHEQDHPDQQEQHDAVPRREQAADGVRGRTRRPCPSWRRTATATPGGPAGWPPVSPRACRSRAGRCPTPRCAP